MTQTVFTTVGYWALGMVVVFIAATAAIRLAYISGEHFADLSEETQVLAGRIMSGLSLLALIYLLIWGCYIVGEFIVALIGSFF